MRIDLTKMQVGAVAAMLRDVLTEDEALYLNMLEGETNLYELVRKLLNEIEQDEGTQAILQTQIEDRLARKARAAQRVKHNREAIMALIECAGLDKLSLPEATLSVRHTNPRLAVNDPAAVPDEYVIQTPKPNLDAIKAAFGPEAESLPNWLRIEPAKPSLTIRKR